MSDNTTIQKASSNGDTIRTEDIGSYKIPVTKIAVGSHGVDGGVCTSNNPFPIQVSSTITRGQMPTLSQLAREGRYQFNMNGAPTGWTTNTHPAVTANTQNAAPGASNQVPMGRAWILVTGEVGVDAGPARTYTQSAGIQQTATTGQVEYIGDAWTLWGMVGSGGGSSQYSWNGGYIAQEYESIQQGYNAATTGGFFCHAHLAVIDITGDLNWDALYTVAVLGDSISWTMPGSNGVTSNTSPKANGRDLWGFRIVERLRDKGASVRLVNKGYGSAQSNSAVIRTINHGWLDFRFDLLIIELGTNDAASNATPSSQYQSNISTLITQAKRINPNCSILVCGPTDTDDATRTPYLPAIRTAAQTAVTNAGGASAKCYYVDLSTAFSASQTQYYGDSSPHLHPNQAGHLLVANVMAPVIATTDFYTNVLGLTGSF